MDLEQENKRLLEGWQEEIENRKKIENELYKTIKEKNILFNLIKDIMCGLKKQNKTNSLLYIACNATYRGIIGFDYKD